MICSICSENLALIDNQILHLDNTQECNFSDIHKSRKILFNCLCGYTHNIDLNKDGCICDVGIFCKDNLKIGKNTNYYNLTSDDIDRSFNFNSYLFLNYPSCINCDFNNKKELSNICEELAIICKNTEYIYAENLFSILIYGKMQFYRYYSISNYNNNLELWNRLISMNKCAKCLKTCKIIINNPYCVECYNIILKNVSKYIYFKTVNNLRLRFIDLYESIFVLFSGNSKCQYCKICEVNESKNIIYNNYFVNICSKCLFFYMQDDINLRSIFQNA